MALTIGGVVSGVSKLGVVAGDPNSADNDTRWVNIQVAPQHGGGLISFYSTNHTDADGLTVGSTCTITFS